LSGELVMKGGPSKADDYIGCGYIRGRPALARVDGNKIYIKWVGGAKPIATLPRLGETLHAAWPEDCRYVVLYPPAVLYDTRTGKDILKVQGNLQTLAGVTPDGNALLFSHHHDSLCRSASVVDAASGRIRAAFTPASEGPFVNVALSPDGRRLVATSDRQFLLFDARTGVPQPPLPYEKIQSARVASISPDGRFMLALGECLSLWGLPR